ncbi:hypothetical protein N9426_01255 [Flavobacteriaceae bacterium]|nr:hypothetical protein [Flavobacteriaceae bacterium]
MKFKLPLSFLLFLSFWFVKAQDSNIQIYTPSKLMQSGQWDIKWFNNL